MNTQGDKAEKFLNLHQRDGILVLPNAFDVVSACLMAETGFEAVATTSGGCAFSLGYCDGENIPRQEMVAAIARISNALDIPVSADMEAGFGRNAEDVSETVEATIKAGAVGINIEDGQKKGPRALLDYDLSVERIKAARSAIDQSGIKMVLNARTDAFMTGEEEPIEVAVTRSNAYLEAGADCAFVIGVSDKAKIAKLGKEIDGPLNVLAGAKSPNIRELEALGVKRVTFGSGFAKAGLSHIQTGLKELRESGTYGWVEGTMGQPDIHRILKHS